MDKTISFLDCTLRDGCYIVKADFGKPTIRGLIRKLKEANVEIIECGWLKNDSYVDGTAYYHVPSDFEQYIDEKDGQQTYVAMIDWDRYNLDFLPEYDGKSIDAIRVVFPYDKYKEGVEVATEIKKKGYGVFLQAANTLAYSDDDLKDLAQRVNKVKPISLSVVDTFGAMYEEDLDRIIDILDAELIDEVGLGFHSHNNQQLSFALSIHFINRLAGKRDIVVDASLCGMGRGAGNATTELVTNYLNTKYHKNYDVNAIMDAIDTYMLYFQDNYKWGYSIPFFIAGMYCCHVNNIAYLTKNHRSNSLDMRNIIESLSPEDRRKYDYDLLEEKYIENHERFLNDDETFGELQKVFKDKKVLLIAPGKTSVEQKDKIDSYIARHKPVVVLVNAMNNLYKGDYLFIMNPARYEYCQDKFEKDFKQIPKIILSNTKKIAGDNETIVSYNRVIKRGWDHYDNAAITCMRMMQKLGVSDLAIAGFDGFEVKGASYADKHLPALNPGNKVKELNQEIQAMFNDLVETTKDAMTIAFVTNSMFNNEDDKWQ